MVENVRSIEKIPRLLDPRTLALRKQLSDENESLIGRRVRFRADFYTTRIMPPRGWTGTIEDERRSSSGLGVTSYIVLLDEPFRSQEQDPRVDATEDEMEPF